jgi:hypothetical protein
LRSAIASHSFSRSFVTMPARSILVMRPVAPALLTLSSRSR